MKKLLTLTLLLLVSATAIFAQKKEQRASPHETAKANNISVTYGRPYMKGRAIFGALVPYGEVWRTGADEATEITFDKGVVFGDRQVSAGTYTLFTIPGKTEWTIIINKQLKQWGAFKYDKNQDLVRITVAPKQLNDKVEEFTIIPTEGELIMQWENTTVNVPLKF